MADAELSVGIIGMGAMGTMYTRRLSDAGWRYLLSCSQKDFFRVTDAASDKVWKCLLLL